MDNLGTERFGAVYRVIAATSKDAAQIGRDIGVEQTIEFPLELVEDGPIRDQIVGRVESVEAVADDRFDIRISYAVDTAGGELTQLINVLFGNVSLKPGIRLIEIDLSRRLLAGFRGPRFGQIGLRKLVGVDDRPLICTALKPMGRSAAELAMMARAFVLGGVDMIKDDHGLADQPFCRFEERVTTVGRAVAAANRETGRNTLYLPNVTAAAGQVEHRAQFAHAAGAGGLLVAPALVGWDTMRGLADSDEIGLPIFSHPAFIGSHVIHPDHGVSHFALFGQLTRLAGADACIFPSYGGRFAFSPGECRDVVAGAECEMGHLKPIFPTPGGGMKLSRIEEMSRFYGRDVVFLIGGDLHRGADLSEVCRHFVDAVRAAVER